MFKVLCVDATPDEGKRKILIDGNIYTVIHVFEPLVKWHGYLLDEVKSDHFYGAFKSCRFIPLSNIDETELIKERQEYETTV